MVGGSARRPDNEDHAAGHGFCYCPGSHKRKRSSGAFCHCHPDSETDEEGEEDEQQRLLNTPRRKKIKDGDGLYPAPKKWVFLQLVPSWNGSLKQLLTETDVWFSKQKRDLEGMSFLETEQGKPFVSVFRRLRLQYIISDLAPARIIEQDAIVPSECLSSVYKQQWFAMLRAEQDSEVRPQEINKEELEGSSMRCGRKLSKDGEYCWRWTVLTFASTYL
ncbi:Germ cell-less protein-like 1 [Saguinus oedipus]|uniref:Germ cell-less protein-like 1 n=1 Tax=Saguinus oedipus TaxID=9490 RepID=A0ABQ9U1S3_SAGOE|nr:Germ cell-less protein-like 1 [Saguinus oedipus]